MRQLKRPPSPDFGRSITASRKSIILEYYNLPDRVRAQQKLDIAKDIELAKHQAIQHLFAAFDGKCAYCETAIRAGDTAQVDFFRPIASASQLTGLASH